MSNFDALKTEVDTGAVLSVIGECTDKHMQSCIQLQMLEDKEIVPTEGNITNQRLQSKPRTYKQQSARLARIVAGVRGKSFMIDEARAVDVVNMDFSKVFDKVPHGRLVQKVKSHGIKDSIQLQHHMPTFIFYTPSNKGKHAICFLHNPCHL